MNTRSITRISIAGSNPSVCLWSSCQVANGAEIGPQNIEFHAPPQHPGFPNDGTQGDAGFSSAEWSPSLNGTSLTWSTETFAQNPNANAIRWGTLYNFRFDSNAPPEAANATIGFFKTGAPITVEIQGPGPTGGPSPTPAPPHANASLQLQLRLRRHRQPTQVRPHREQRHLRRRPSTSRRGCELRPVIMLASADSSSRERLRNMWSSGPVDLR